MSRTQPVGAPGGEAGAEEGSTGFDRAFWLVFFGTLLVYLVNTNASPLGDSAAAFPIASSIVSEQNLTLNEFAGAEDFASGGWVERTESGDLVGYFPWAAGLAAVPIVVAVDLASVVGIGDGAQALIEPMGRAHAVLQSIAGAVWTAIAVAGVFVLAREHIPRRSVWFAGAVAVVFAFGTSAWSTAAYQLWQHGPSLACTTWAIVMLQRLETSSSSDWARRRVIQHGAGLGVLVGLAAIFRPTNFIVVAAVSIVVAVRYRSLLVPYVLGGSAIAVPWFIATRLAYGTWLQPYGGSDRLKLHDEFVEALAANLFSSGRGIFVFSPIVVVAAIGGFRAVRSMGSATPLQKMSLVVIVLYWTAISALPHWTGGHSFGPRLFTDALPFMVVLALPVLARLPSLHRGPFRAVAFTVLVVALSAVSVAVHAQSTLVISTRGWNRFPVDVDQDYGRVWSLDDPMVTAGYRDLLRDPSASIRGICTRRSSQADLPSSPPAATT